jgi:hypothetical protein
LQWRGVVWDAETEREIVLSPIDLISAPPPSPNKDRWKIELFFKLKQNVTVKNFVGTSETHLGSRFGQP